MAGRERPDRVWDVRKKETVRGEATRWFWQRRCLKRWVEKKRVADNLQYVISPKRVYMMPCSPQSLAFLARVRTSTVGHDREQPGKLAIRLGSFRNRGLGQKLPSTGLQEARHGQKMGNWKLELWRGALCREHN